MPKQPSARALGIAARVQAQLEGLDKYQGQPCQHGHTDRYANTGMCVQCCADRTAASRARLKRQTREELQAEIDHLKASLADALDAESRAWSRVAELEDRYEPRNDNDLEPIRTACVVKGVAA